jgi:hypothetical protein
MKLLLATLIFLLHAQTAYAQLGQFPSVNTETLSERALELPKQLPAKLTVVMAGYEFNHQAQMDLWLEKLMLKQLNQEWLQFHLIGGGWRWLSSFVNSRKRPYFPDEYQRSRVAPIYTDVEKFNQSMQWGGVNQIHVALVDQTGKVVFVTNGEYSPEKGQQLLDFLKQAS